MAEALKAGRPPPKVSLESALLALEWLEEVKASPICLTCSQMVRVSLVTANLARALLDRANLAPAWLESAMMRAELPSLPQMTMASALLFSVRELLSRLRAVFYLMIRLPP